MKMYFTRRSCPITQLFSQPKLCEFIGTIDTLIGQNDDGCSWYQSWCRKYVVGVVSTRLVA